MFLWFRCLFVSLFFSEWKKARWKNKESFDGGSDMMLFLLSGLTANGFVGLKQITRAFKQQLQGRVGVMQCNLGGHDGMDFNVLHSRMWSWIGDAANAVASILEKKKQVILVGYSTGALVVLLLGWAVEGTLNFVLKLFSPLLRFLRFGYGIDRFSKKILEKRGKILGIVLIVPAFKLQSRENEGLLWLAFVFYYLFLPFWMIASIFCYPSLFLLFLSVFWICRKNLSLLKILVEEKDGSRKVNIQSVVQIIIIAFYSGLTPLLILLLGTKLTYEVFIQIMLFYLLSVVLITTSKYCSIARTGEFSTQEEGSTGYPWIPVISASTMLVLQRIARLAVSRVKIPILVVIGNQDDVVDNLFTQTLIRKGEEICCLDASHSGWGAGEANALSTVCCDWFRRNNLLN